MKWIGQKIQDVVSRFRNDIYLEGLSSSSETDILVVDSNGKITTNASAGGGGGGGGNQIMLIDVGDETTNLTAGVAKKTFRIPYNFNVSEIRASVNTAPVGSTVIVDVNQNGTSILNTKLSIDASEETSYTASAAYGIKNPFLLKDDEITIDIDQIGSGTAGKGLKLLIIGTEITAATALYHLTASASTVDEGSAVTFSMHTFGVADSTTIAYAITGIAAGDITESLTGNLTVNSNVATQVINAIADMSSESSEVMTMTAQALTAQVTIVNVNPTYAIARSVSTIVEGTSVVFTLNTTGVPNSATTSYAITGIAGADISGSLTGNFTTNNNTAALTVTAAIDGSTEGTETMTITAGGATQTCDITDPPTGSPYSNSLYFDGSNDYLEAGSYYGYPPGTVETDFAGWDLITDTKTTPYTMDIEFRNHNGGPSSSIWDIDIEGWKADGSASSGSQYGTWRVNFSTSGYALFARIWWYMPWFDNGNSNDYNAAGNKYAYHHCTLPITNHFTDSNNPVGNGRYGMWHKLTITRGTSGAIDSSNIKIYLNGQEGTGYGSYTGHFSDVPSNKWNGTQHRSVKIGHYASKVTIGSISIYDKELSLAEINDIYDGGARAGGSADQAEIMNQDHTGKSTNGNLVHYYYLDVDGQDGDDDSGTILQDKKGNDLDFQTQSSTISSLTSVTTPQLPLFVPASPPAAVYTGESTTFTQPSSGSGGVVTWYTDSNRTVLVNTGEDYTWTPSSLGAATLYTKDVRGGVIQTAEFAYTVYAAGYSTHSFDVYTKGQDAQSADFALSNFTDGSFSLHFWACQQEAYNSWLYMIWGGDYQNYVAAHGNTSNYFWYTVLGGTTTYTGSVAKEVGANWLNMWVPWTIVHDVPAGTFKTFGNGALLHTHSAGVGTSYGAANNTLAVKIDDRWGKIANIGLYGEALTDAEAIATQGGAGGGDIGDSVDLTSLSSSSKLFEYWKINNDTYSNSSGDVLTGINGNHIAVANSPSSLKSTDRP